MLLYFSPLSVQVVHADARCRLARYLAGRLRCRRVGSQGDWMDYLLGTANPD
jgi:hypothetical protein